MTILNSDQLLKLAAVRKADEAWREAKVTAMAEARRQVEGRVAEFAARRAEAVCSAVEAGAPKAQVGRVGLLTKSPSTVDDILAAA